MQIRGFYKLFEDKDGEIKLNLNRYRLCNKMIDTFIENVKELAQRTENDVLFLTDLLGASPYNATAQAMNHCRNKKIVSVSGVNLPMVIEAVFKRDTMEVTELADDLVEIASQGIAKLAFEL